MSNGKIQGKQIVNILLSPSETPLSIDSYTVSATASSKQLVNVEYLETYVTGITPSSLQETTNIGNTTSNDLEITDFNSGVILRSPDNNRWRLTINNDGQIIAEQL